MGYQLYGYGCSARTRLRRARELRYKQNAKWRIDHQIALHLFADISTPQDPRYEGGMKSLCAYDSSSSSDDESPKNKKPKATETDRTNSVREARNVGLQAEDTMVKRHAEPSNASGLLERKASESKQNTTCSPLNLSDRFESRVVNQTNHNKNTPAFIASVARKTQSNSSFPGSSVRPYVSKRERERLTQTIAATSVSTLYTTNNQLEKIHSDHS